MQTQQLSINTDLEVKIEGNKIYAPLKSKWLTATPEEQVRQNYIAILVNQYGFALQQMDQEVKVSNSQRGQGKARADVVIYRSEEDRKNKKKAIVVVECKAQNVNVRQEDYFQGYNYARWAHADFFVTTNEKETKFFKVVEEHTERFDEIVELPTAKDFSSDKKIQELLTKTKEFTRDEFSKLLIKCHNIIRNNDKLSPEAAFDEISKILFMKIRYERQQSVSQAKFSEKRFVELKNADLDIRGKNPAIPFYQYLFEQTKTAFADDDLFDPNDSLRIRENSFLQIVRELEKYNLSDTSDDIKGIAFEEFLGRTFRGELGQFFTPRTIVDYMADVLDPQEGEIICDPCCGSGGFLIKAFEYVRDKIERHVQAVKEEIKKEFYTDEYDKLSDKEQAVIDQQVQKHFDALNEELNLNNTNGRLRRLSYDCIFGTDANPRMARTAKMNMIMHGDGHGGVHHHDGLLNVNGIFDGRFDVILTNPPFGARVEKSLHVTANDLPSVAKIDLYNKRYDNYEEVAVNQLRDHIDKPILDLFTVGQYSGLTEVLFMERCINLLKPGGRMGVVLPEGVLNNSALQRIRELFESRAKLINITSIPQDVFIASGATVKPSLVFLRKFTDDEAAKYSNIVAEETSRVNDIYATQLADLDKEYAAKRADLKLIKDKAGVKTLDKEHHDKRRVIEDQVIEEVKQAVKTRFNYPIPMVEVEKAGISSTGAKIENELEDVAKEYRTYRLANKLWDNKYQGVEYVIPDSGELSRILMGEELPVYQTARRISAENFI